jgi:hypothetical protein
MQCPYRVCEPGKWAQCATCYAKKGRLHAMLHKALGVPVDVKITQYPYRKILIAVKRGKIGTKVRYGRKSTTITRLLKNRVIFALNMNPV